jgi:DNA mismatch repair protein MutL
VRTVPPPVRAVDAPAPRVDVHGALFDETKGFYASLRYVGQVKRMFLLCEGADGLYVLDQHAAAERVTFDRLRKAYGEGIVASQPLLIPAVFPASPAEVAAAEAIEEANLPLGLELGGHGPNAIAVRAVPAMLKRVAPEMLARDLLAEFTLEAQRPFADRLDMVFATMACHGSLRAGDAVSEGEARALLDSLDGVDFGGHCPHGRPVVTRLSFSELERRVGRP